MQLCVLNQMQDVDALYVSHIQVNKAQKGRRRCAPAELSLLPAATVQWWTAGSGVLRLLAALPAAACHMVLPEALLRAWLESAWAVWHAQLVKRSTAVRSLEGRCCPGVARSQQTACVGEPSPVLVALPAKQSTVAGNTLSPASLSSFPLSCSHRSPAAHPCLPFSAGLTARTAASTPTCPAPATLS